MDRRPYLRARERREQPSPGWPWPSGNGTAMAQRWLGSGPAVALVQHVLVATRGWCCLAEGPAADRPLCRQDTRSLSPATAPCSPRDSQPAVGSAPPASIPGQPRRPHVHHRPPQDSFVTMGLLARASPRLCTGTSVVQMHLTGAGKGSDSAGKAAVSQEAPASHFPGEAEVPAWIHYQASSLPQVLLLVWTWLQ